MNLILHRNWREKMIQDTLQAFILILMAEMGDKTQILAMAFATKYPVKKVLLGIMIGCFLNHGIAVALGSQLIRIVPLNAIQIIAGIAFVCFGVWSLRFEEEEDTDQVNGKYGAVITVAAAFFIGELGDKTQLTAITLSAESSAAIFILIGTVAGMVATGGLGIFVGKKLGNQVPEIVVKTIASLIFLIFGSIKLIYSVPRLYVTFWSVAVYLAVIILIFIVLFRKSYRGYREGVSSKYVLASKELYDYYASLENKVAHLCRGTENCGHCDGILCPIGNTKEIIKNALKDMVKSGQLEQMDFKLYKQKKFDVEIINEIVKETKNMMGASPHSKRSGLECILANMKVIQR